MKRFFPNLFVVCVFLFSNSSSLYAQQVDLNIYKSQGDGCNILTGNTLVSYNSPPPMIWSFSSVRRAKYNQITTGTAGTFLDEAFFGTWRAKGSRCCWKMDVLKTEDCFTFQEIKLGGGLKSLQTDQCWISDRKQRDKCFKTNQLEPKSLVKISNEDGWEQNALLYDGIISTGKVVRGPINPDDLRPVSREQFKENFGLYPEEMKLEIVE